MATLIGRLQSTMQLGGVSFTVSPEVRRQMRERADHRGGRGVPRSRRHRDQGARRPELQDPPRRPQHRRLRPRPAPDGRGADGRRSRGGRRRRRSRRHEHGAGGGQRDGGGRVSSARMRSGPRRDRRHARRPDADVDGDDRAVGARAGRGAATSASRRRSIGLLRLAHLPRARCSRASRPAASSPATARSPCARRRS